MTASLAERLAALPETERKEVLGALPPDEAAALEHSWEFWARPEQLPPETPWMVWAVVSGRGGGKTRSGAEFVHERERKGFGRFLLVARTAADYRDTMVEGESGILATQKPDRPCRFIASRRQVEWASGATALCFSAEEPDQIRGPQGDSGWADEPSTWKFLPGTDGLTAWDNLQFAVRLGNDPRIVATLTPKPIPFVRELMVHGPGFNPVTGIHLTTGSLYDNLANLAPQFVERIVGRYGGTRLGEQEIHGRLLDEVEGALWTLALIEAGRQVSVPDLSHVVVGVDPPGNTAECGIVVSGLSREKQETRIEGRVALLPHVYVLEDASLAGAPEVWARAAVAAYHRFRADRIVAEQNCGYDMVRSVIANVDPVVPVKLVSATRGKRTRAEPVAQLYDQGRAHHVGYFGDLESQQSTWVPGDDSPDRMDALVWSVTALLPDLAAGPAQTSSPAQQRLPRTGANPRGGLRAVR